MLTIFATPKPFEGGIGISQRNAITSWTLLRPRPEIILFGNEKGTAEISRELGACHVPEIAREDFEAPLLNDIFKKAQRLGRSELLCYVNSDIILMSDFMRAVETIKRQKSFFVISGGRREVRVDRPLDFRDKDWEQKLIAAADKEHMKNGAEYFVFPRGFFADIPPFIVGRAPWDAWMLWRVRAKKALLVDVSPVVFAIHQSHCYRDDRKFWEETDKNFELAEEAMWNPRLFGSDRFLYFCESTHRLTKRGLRQAWPGRSLCRLFMCLRHLLVYRLATVRDLLGLHRSKPAK